MKMAPFRHPIAHICRVIKMAFKDLVNNVPAMVLHVRIIDCSNNEQDRYCGKKPSDPDVYRLTSLRICDIIVRLQ